MVGDIAHIENRVLDLVLNPYSPRLHIRRAQVGIGYAECAGRIEGVIIRLLEWYLENRLRDLGPVHAECSTQAEIRRGGLQPLVWALDIVQDCGDGFVIDEMNAVTSPDRRLASAEYIPGKAQIGSEVISVLSVKRAPNRLSGEVQGRIGKKGRNQAVA